MRVVDELPVEIKDMAEVCYQTYARILSCTMCPDLVDSFSDLDETDQNSWLEFTEGVLSVLPDCEGKRPLAVARGLEAVQAQVFGDYVKDLGLPNLVALEGFVRMMSCFFDPENDREDIRGYLRNSYNWEKWAVERITLLKTQED